MPSRNRALHTSARRPGISDRADSRAFKGRDLHLRHPQAVDILRNTGLPTTGREVTNDYHFIFILAVTIDRSKCCPCIVVRTSSHEDPWAAASMFLFPLGQLPESCVPSIATRLGLVESSNKDFTSICKIIHGLIRIFEDNEALLLETRLSRDAQDNLVISKADFWFDDAACKIARRQQDIHALRKINDEEPEEVEAEQNGIVYVKYS